MKTNQTIGQREQKLKVQVHGDDQSPHPGRLHGASLATAMQRPCRPLPVELGWRIGGKKPFAQGWTHTHAHIICHAAPCLDCQYLHGCADLPTTTCWEVVMSSGNKMDQKTLSGLGTGERCERRPSRGPGLDFSSEQGKRPEKQEKPLNIGAKANACIKR